MTEKEAVMIRALTLITKIGSLDITAEECVERIDIVALKATATVERIDGYEAENINQAK